MFKFGYKSVVI